MRIRNRADVRFGSEAAIFWNWFRGHKRSEKLALLFAGKSSSRTVSGTTATRDEAELAALNAVRVLGEAIDEYLASL